MGPRDLTRLALDRYLTTPPDNNDSYAEAIGEALSNEFYSKHEDWFMSDPQCDKWIAELESREIVPSQAAKIIERAHRLFINRT